MSINKIQISDKMSRQIWVQTVCKATNVQAIKVTIVGEELKTILATSLSGKI